MTSITQAARAEDAAAEEQFLEKTPWANPYHPAHHHHHHALLLERQASAAGAMPTAAAKLGTAISTPAGQHWSHEMHRGAGSEGLNAVVGSASTIAASDPPSANGPSHPHAHSHNPRARGAAFAGFGSSPIDRRTAQFQRNGNNNGVHSQTMPYLGLSAPAPIDEARPLPPQQGKHMPGPATEQSAPHQPLPTGAMHPAGTHDMYNTTPYNARSGIFGAPGPAQAAATADSTGPPRRETNPFINNAPAAHVEIS